MKKLFLIIFLLCFVLPLTTQAGCPKGKYFDSKAGRCITPGQDPTGEADRTFIRDLIEEGQGYCLDGWCCPNRSIYLECLRSGHREGTGKCKNCVIRE
jgi:hypothetical protein